MAFQHKLIDLSNKPDELVQKHNQAQGSYGAAKVPLLEHNANLVVESDVVARYVAQHLEGQNEIDLLPYKQADRIDAFLRVWDPVVDTYYGVLTSSNQKQVNVALKRFKLSLHVLEEDLKQGSADDTFVCPDFSLAECIAAPWVQRFFVTLPYYRNIDFDEMVHASYPRVARWMDAVRVKPSVVASQCPEEEMLAAAERYYVSFVSPGAPGRL